MTAEMVAGDPPPAFTAADRYFSYIGAVPHPRNMRDVPPANDVAAFNRYLWLDEYQRHATHGVVPMFTRRAVAQAATQAEDDAAQWMASHPQQVRADLSGAVFLFGGGA